MKQATNFRLEQDVLTTISVLANDLHTTKTDVIEKAVIQYAASLGTKRNSLLQFAGSLDANEADTILNTIYLDKNSKDINLHL
jgi:hypothetical protein